MHPIIELALLTILSGLLILVARKCAKNKNDLIKTVLIIGITFIGGLSNKITKMANGNKMPVSLTAMETSPFFSDEAIAAVKHGAHRGYFIMTEKTKLRFLADIIPLPGGVGSGGDILNFFSFILLGVWFFRRKEKTLGLVLIILPILTLLLPVAIL